MGWVWGGEGGRTELGGEFEGVAGALEAGAGHDELGAPDVGGALDDAGEVVGMAGFAVVSAAEDGVGEVDADLDVVARG